MAMNNMPSDIERAIATRRAEELYADLTRDDGFPCFVISMLRSHVVRGLWEHLPTHDETINLVDGSGKEFRTNYLVQKLGLTKGWRQFAMFHDLLDGDALVFQLIEPAKLKVHIIRAIDPLTPHTDDGPHYNKKNKSYRISKVICEISTKLKDEKDHPRYEFDDTFTSNRLLVN